MNWAREAEILNCQEEEKLQIAECSDSERWTLFPEGEELAHSRGGPREYILELVALAGASQIPGCTLSQRCHPKPFHCTCSS